MSDIKVSHADNRGDDEMQFGFVYFTDGRRVVYITREGRQIVPPEASTGGWAPITSSHVRAAQAALDKWAADRKATAGEDGS